MTVETKRCPACSRNLPFDRYHKDTHNRLGIRTRCKECCKSAREGRKNQRICTVCSGKLDTKGLCCSRCTNRRSGLDAQRRAKSIADGRCVSCTNPKLEHSQLCLKCWLEEVAKRNLGFRKYGIQLGEMLERQNYLCPYTGNKLIPGINASLDHIRPVHHYPERARDITNVEWVSKEVNEMKRDRTPEQFLSLASKIVNYYTLDNFPVASC